ncbi:MULTISPECIES: DinB family protein [Acidobacteriaceae]|uniref:DinB family protein n=1 Tax=Acidobacteriaceae TaxID=204434 RepID=UPI00131E2BE7|nr:MULTISPECIES: DinB family protein [Acidobacteriaceae]MDW5266210.1 DinB family protein [Edaphobacter sp.]
MVEPWLRGTLIEVDAVRRGVLHALELAREDIERWSADLSDAELEVAPLGLPSVGRQMRHIVRSLDRLLTYAEGRQLSAAQLEALNTEADESASRRALFAEFEEGISSAMERVRAFRPESYGDARGVGRKMLPTTLGGLLVHCADHTQRHAGQLVTTAKVIVALRS